MNITHLPLNLIDEDKDQPRYQFNQEALEELANSIKEIGLLSPIKVRKSDNGRYKIIYGNRRYKAATMVGLVEIPCIISEATNELDIYFEQIAENLTREDFSPIEEAEAFHKLMNDGKFRSSIKLLASKLGKTESYIKNKCELLKFSTAVKKIIISGTQIKKGFLVEDQLLPLKDLPLEYSNPIALIAAKDELPVSDVKKIAKMFKDSSVPDAVKEKLLLKDGPGLIDSWSVYEQNRKEKIAREKEKAEKAKALEEARLAKANNPVVLDDEYVNEPESAEPFHQQAMLWQTDDGNESDDYIAVNETNQDYNNEQRLDEKWQVALTSRMVDEQKLSEQLLLQLSEGQAVDPDKMEQLALSYLSHLHQAESQWKTIIKQIALLKLED